MTNLFLSFIRSPPDLIVHHFLKCRQLNSFLLFVQKVSRVMKSWSGHGANPFTLPSTAPLCSRMHVTRQIKLNLDTFYVLFLIFSKFQTFPQLKFLHRLCTSTRTPFQSSFQSSLETMQNTERPRSSKLEPINPLEVLRNQRK